MAKKDFVYMVKYDNGWEFEYSLFHKIEEAEKEWQRYYNTYWFDDLEDCEIERQWKYRINDIYWGAWLDLIKVDIN